MLLRLLPVILSMGLLAAAGQADAQRRPNPLPGRRPGVAVPELDATSAGSAAVLLLGGAAVIVARRRKQKA